LARQLALKHQLLGRKRGARYGFGFRTTWFCRWKHRKVVGATTHGIEERVVGLIDACLRRPELVIIEQRRRREASPSVDLTLPFERPSHFCVVRRATDSKHRVVIGLGEDRQQRRWCFLWLGLGRREGDDASCNALDVASRFRRRAVDEERFSSANR